MTSYFNLLLPELLLGTVACVLMLMGCSTKAATRRLVPMIALAALIVVFVIQMVRLSTEGDARAATDASATFRVFHFAQYVKLLTAGIGAILVLLAWPTNAEATGNSAMNVRNNEPGNVMRDTT